MKRTGIFLAAAAACAVAAGLAAAAPKPVPPVADAAGNLHVPADYASRYDYLGAWAVAADKAPGSSQMHIVYASPGAIAAFKRTGHFPQGAVLVKEVRDTETAAMTTGTVSHSTKLKGWFVAVRDTQNSHPGNKLWGDGWGWSWFDADKPLHTTSTDYHNDCLACHQPAKSTGWMYTLGYPALQH
jgi:hypothetical protein